MIAVYQLERAVLDTNTLMEIEIRPGVPMPDWSVVNSPQAKDALNAILDAFDADKAWRGYTADEDLIRSSIIWHFAKAGRAPSLVELSAATGMEPDTLKTNLERLRQRDLVVMDTAESIAGAYPLTDRETEHKVRLAAHTVYAMCAVDALGVGAMFGEDIDIVSVCRHCHAPIKISLQNARTKLASVAPQEAVVWAGTRTDEGCAADALCTVITFFSCKDHLDTWHRENRPDIEGYRLSVEEGLQVGRGLFGPTLRGTSAELSGWPDG